LDSYWEEAQDEPINEVVLQYHVIWIGNWVNGAGICGHNSGTDDGADRVADGRADRVANG
jgi:hypothetical protein